PADGRPRRQGVTDTVKPQPDDPVRDLRFRLGIERSGVGVWDFDLVSQEVTWSDNAGELFGVSGKRKVTYDFFLSLLDPLDRERVKRAIAQTVEAGTRLDTTFSIAARPAARHWIRLRAGLVRSEDGRPHHLSGLAL